MFISRKEFNELKKRVSDLEWETNITYGWHGSFYGSHVTAPVKEVVTNILSYLGIKITYISATPEHHKLEKIKRRNRWITKQQSMTD